MRRCILLLLMIAYGSTMKMQETVERTVMVRTTGSDLQPAATGYIYKKGTDGEAVVTKMGETEVMEQLSKLYEQPKAFAAPIPISSPFSEDEETKAALKTEENVKPVVEKAEDTLDGIADDDYRHLFDEYASNFDEYLKGLKTFKDGTFDGYDNKGYGFDVHHDLKHPAKGYHYGKQGAGDYDTKKFESYRISKTDDKLPFDSDTYGKHYKSNEYSTADYGYKGPKSDSAFHYKEADEKDYKNSPIEGHYKYGDEAKLYGNGGSGNGHNFAAEHHDDLGYGRESHERDSTGANSDEDTTTGAYDFESESRLAPNSFGYEVKH